MTYCFGKGCVLCTSCVRYKEGQRIILNVEGDTDQHRFMDCCEPESRELYIPHTGTGTV